MHFPIQNPQYLIWVFAIILPMVFSLSFSDPRTTKASMLCGPSENSDINFIPKFIKLMEFLSENVTYDRWGHQSIGHPPPEIFGLAQCHEDLSQTDCLLCFAEARTKLPKCLPSNSARLYLDGCFLRYDNYSFFHETVDPKRDSLKCSDRTGVIEDPYMKMELTKKVEMVVKNATETAVMNGGFAAAEVKGGVVGVYALAQCWKTIDEKGCRECLANAVTRVIGCVPGGEGRVLNAGCYLRYSTKKFYGLGAESKQADDGLSKIGVIIASTVLAAIAITILSLFGAFIGYTRILKIREGDFSPKEASDVLQVGLLCTQASTALRPSMPEVVQMLNDKESEIPSPKQPPFLNSSVLGSDDSTKSSSINGLSLSRHSIAEMSSSSYKSAMISPESNGPSTVETSELSSLCSECA
ncbi:hypothetical protein L1049_027724 [Liquidambar formosana]|uniref:Gnk2-homologous domain-containing protein n=1 Tax=Liquidambar formosana TaxID=63359 RepID=A0AAP0RIH5_LIQFO